MRLHKKRPVSEASSETDSFVLPRFSFESESDLQLVLTDRLFLDFTLTETSYDPGLRLVGSDDQDDEAVVVSSYWPYLQHLADVHARSHGTAHTTLQTRLIGRGNGSG